jgi:hypothetical protein
LSNATLPWASTPFRDRFIPQPDSPATEGHYLLTDSDMRRVVGDMLIRRLSPWFEYDTDFEDGPIYEDSDAQQPRTYRYCIKARILQQNLLYQEPSLSPKLTQGTIGFAFYEESLAVELDFPYSCYDSFGIHLEYNQRTLVEIMTALHIRLRSLSQLLADSLADSAGAFWGIKDLDVSESSLDDYDAHAAESEGAEVV